MNKQEAIEEIKKHSTQAYDDFAIMRDTAISIINQLDEPEKPVVPQFVADWYEEHKDNLNESIWEHLVNWDDANWDGFHRWISQPDENGVIITLVNMHQFGYDVEKEPRYTVKLKNQEGYEDYLVKTDMVGYRFFKNVYTNRRIHTRKELEANGFGWVFDCEGVEMEEVE